MLGDPFSTNTYNKFGEDILISGMPKNWIQNNAPGIRILLPLPISTHVSTGILLCVLIRNFSQMTHRLVTVPSVPLTRSSSLCLLQWAKCRPGNAQIGGTLLPIVNLMADSEWGSPLSYSSFLLIICLICLSLSFGDWWMDGQTMQTHYCSWPTLWQTS